MDAVLDLVRVLYEPVPVFERVRDQRKFLAPFIVVSLLEMAIAYLILPFQKAATAASVAALIAAHPERAAGAQMASGSILSAVFAPVGLLIALAIGASVLWVLVSLVGGEANWGTSARVVLYTMGTTLLFQILSLGVVMINGIGKMKSPQDIHPPLGLDLAVPGAGPVLQPILGYINPFTIWALVLVAIGVQVTQKTSKGGAYAVAVINTLVALGFVAVAAYLGKP